MYTILGISGCASQDLIFKTSQRYMKEKEALKMELDTFYKYNKNESISVVINFFEYPHLADLKISRNEKEIIVFFKLTADNEECLNHQTIELQQESEHYWTNKGQTVVILRN